MSKLENNPTPLGQKGVVHLIPLILLLAGIIAGVYLVQKTQIFKPKATSKVVDWVISTGQDPDNCVTTKEGKTVTTCPKVKFKLTKPADIPNSNEAEGDGNNE